MSGTPSDDAITLKARLETDLRIALRSGDTLQRDTVRLILAAVKYQEIELGRGLEPPEEITLLRREAKRRGESIEQFRAGHREDLVRREEQELTIIEGYLPAEMSDQDVERIVAEVIASTGATSVRDLGRVMPVLMKRAGGNASGGRLSESVRRQLSSSTGVTPDTNLR